jgi:hypothetical protein
MYAFNWISGPCLCPDYRNSEKNINLGEYIRPQSLIHKIMEKKNTSNTLHKH